MPDAVIRHIGGALSVAQYGGKHPDAKPWKGLGSGVFEVVSDLEARTFRAVYVVRLERAIYVLHTDVAIERAHRERLALPATRR
jgi:phage-related protein